MVPDYTLVDTHTHFKEDVGDLVRHDIQYLDTEFLDTLKSERFAKAHLRRREMDRVASVPTFVVELWLRRDGFNVYQESARAIVAKLKREDLGAFITTPGSV